MTKNVRNPFVNGRRVCPSCKKGCTEDEFRFVKRTQTYERTCRKCRNKQNSQTEKNRAAGILVHQPLVLNDNGDLQ